DCMDLDVGFYDNPSDQRYIQNIAEALFRRAALVVCSSQYLETNVKARHSGAKTLVLRNGVQQAWLEHRAQALQNSTSPTRLGYFGTIAPWFDWDLMLRVLEQSPDLQLELIGPNHTRTVQHPRVKYHGVIAHTELQQRVQHLDGFVMPFVRSPLIEGVDPVKLYEYLSLGKEVFAVSYPEISRFAPFVHLYNSEQHLFDLLTAWQEGTLVPRNTQPQAFLLENTWEARVRVLSEAIGQLIQDTLR
ncbi:MAG: hypothetical protein ACK41E_09055, partial [Deinococcales bacterium]